MQFKTQEQFALVSCETCHGTGYVNFRRCPMCKAMSVARHDGENVLFYGEPFTYYHIRVKRARKKLHIMQMLFGLIFWLGLWGLFAWLVNERELVDAIFTIEFWIGELAPIKGLFWFGLISFSYMIYRMMDMKEEEPDMHYDNDNDVQQPQSMQLNNWQDIRTLPHKQKENIATYFTHNAKHVLENAYVLAYKQRAPEVTLPHVLVSLMQEGQIKGIFVRLGISLQTLEARFKQLIPSDNQSQIKPAISTDVEQIIFHAYEYARDKKDSRVRSTQILLAAVLQSEHVQEIMYDLNVDAQKLMNVIEWVRQGEHQYEQYRAFRRAAARMSKHGMDRAMTAVATPYLNQFSSDLTLAAKFGRVESCVAREKELDEIFRIVESGRGNVLLVGERGVGKMNMIGGIVQRMIAGNAPERLLDKRMVQISTTALLAGTTVSGAQERLIRIMNEVARAKNIILFINNIHDLTGASGTENEGLDMSEALAEYLGSGRFLMFAAALPDSYNRHIARSEMGTLFSRVDVKEMDENQAIQVLESKVAYLESTQRVFFSYDAIERCVNLAQKFMYDQVLPESAIGLMTEVASYTRSKKGERQLVTGEEVAQVVSEKTGIPVASLSQDEGQKLMTLEEEMHKRMVGQDIAVTMVAQSLRRARAEMRSQDRPIANFLFLGPTGVGKTELAKTIANVYFGGEERMIRIDMSEYQDVSGIYRLIGEAGKQGTGYLTEAVRQQPFSLILLDELEKAHKDVLNIFLQVFDDGRLTDSVGRVVDFSNTIIIATSNAGTAYVQEQMNAGVDVETIRDHLIRAELRDYYRPEFLNRFDGIVLFKALTREEIKQIAGLMLKRVAKDLEERGVEFRVEDAALESLAEVGFDPEFGARPMRRAIQDRVENQLADLILQNKLERRDIVVLGDACQVRVERG